MHTIHEGHKDHKCESCGKSFSQEGDLKKHIHTVHERHKDYKCDSCGKSFTTANYLKKHIHTIHESRDRKVQIFHEPRSFTFICSNCEPRSLTFMNFFDVLVHFSSCDK